MSDRGTVFFDSVGEVIPAMFNAGVLYPPLTLEATPKGKPLRCGTEGKPSGKDASVVIYSDCKGGWFQNHRTGERRNWQIKQEFTREQKREFAKKKTEDAAETKRKHERMGRVARGIYGDQSIAPPADFPYLVRKRIHPFTAKWMPRYENDTLGKLVIPGFQVDGTFSTVQYIYAEEGYTKPFLKDASMRGAYCPIGSAMDYEVLCLVEGFATGASIHMATGYPIAVAFNAGNLEPVALALRERFPRFKLVICGDDDLNRERDTGTNPGREKALATAKAVDGIAVFPTFKGAQSDSDTDFNDMFMLYGLGRVRERIEVAISAG